MKSSKFNVGDEVYYTAVYKNEDNSYILSVELGVIEKILPYNNFKNFCYVIDGQIFNEKQLYHYRYRAVHALENKLLSFSSFSLK